MSKTEAHRESLLVAADGVPTMEQRRNDTKTADTSQLEHHFRRDDLCRWWCLFHHRNSPLALDRLSGLSQIQRCTPLVPRRQEPESLARMAASMRALLRKRPMTSFVFLGGAGTTACAYAVERRADELERKHSVLVGGGSSRSGQHPEDAAKYCVLPREYDWNALNEYWTYRPVTAATRLFRIVKEMAPFVGGCVSDFVIRSPDPSEAAELHARHARELREILTNLGPAFVKAGQQLSIRPDLAPPVVLKELQKLCDSVRPIPDDVAMQVIREELGKDNLDEVFADMELVAAASLGQVYKARIRESSDVVAVKVQRPDMRRNFSLDLYLLQRIGVLVDVFTSMFTNQPPFHKALYESFAQGSYMELDYENEAKNQLRFRKEFADRRCPVVVPEVYSDLSTERVLTTQWIDGIKLADSPKEQIRKLIPVGVEVFLTQLLDMGAFHSDPHPGNLLVTTNGQVCLIDFGLCAEVDEQSRNAITKAIYHLLMRDFDTLVSKDAIELGFLPEDFDTTEIKPLITKILTVGLVESGSDLRNRKRKLMEISNELNEVFFRYPFSVPPFFALITRGLGLLEGIAISGDPEFDIFRASAPFARRRAIKLLGRNTFHRNSPRLSG